MEIIASLFLGFFPMLCFAGFVNWLDRFEKEPKILLGAAFTWGAIIAAGGAFIINTVFDVGLVLVSGSEGIGDIGTAVISAPLVEESLKGLAVLLVFLIFRREFDSVLDGMIYAAITALGFAATENALYIYDKGFAQSGWSGLLTVAFIRIIIVGWQHPFFTAFTGIGLAIARLDRRVWIKILAPIAGLVMAMTVHSLHNLIASTGEILICMAGSLLDWSGWLIMFGFVIFMIFREKKWLSIYLQEEVKQGLITPHQYKVASSLFGRTWEQITAISRGGFFATSRFYQLCGELSHKKRQMATLGNETGNAEVIFRIRDEIRHLAPKVPA